MFLGVMFDTESCTLSLSEERLLEIRDLISDWLDKVEASRKELQSLLGKLNFVASCVRPGRIFISRLLETLRSLNDTGVTLLSPSFKKDLLWWHKFLPTYNGVSMMPFEEWTSTDSVLSFGISGDSFVIVMDNEYCCGEIPVTVEGYAVKPKVKEVIVLLVALKIWGSSLHGQRFKVYCQHACTVQAINHGRSKDDLVQACLREIWFIAAQYEFECKVIIGATDNNHEHLSVMAHGSDFTRHMLSPEVFHCTCNW